jgi:hypothetical protein
MSAGRFFTVEVTPDGGRDWALRDPSVDPSDEGQNWGYLVMGFSSEGDPVTYALDHGYAVRRACIPFCPELQPQWEPTR